MNMSAFHKMSSWGLLVVAVVFHTELVEYLIKQKAILYISNNDRIIKKRDPLWM